jgi:predicted Zn-ribbon and HTH transcriptional regulator
MIHDNSRKSYEEEIERGNPKRYRDRILELLEVKKIPMTDRQIMMTLNVEEKSNILPEITRMVAKGVLYEYDRVKCKYTGKTVRRTAIFTKAMMKYLASRKGGDKE